MLDSLLDFRYARELTPLNLSLFDSILSNTINSGQQGKSCARSERIVCLSINRRYTSTLERSGVSRMLPVLPIYFHFLLSLLLRPFFSPHLFCSVRCRIPMVR